MGNSIKEQLIEKIFNLGLQKYVNLENEKIEFLDGRFQVKLSYDKHFSNLYRVIDTNTKEEKDLKIILIKNDPKIIDKIGCIMKKYIGIKNQNIINIDSFYFDYYSKQGKTMKLFIIQEPKSFVTLNDFLNVFLLEIFNSNYSISIVRFIGKYRNLIIKF